MAPGSRIGSAMPIMITPLGGGVAELPEGYEEKILSDTRALVRGLAQENGYREDVATAMVDRSKELRIGERLLCPEGDLLNLTADEAVEIIPPDTEPVLASGKVTSIDELLEAVGLSGLRIERISEEPAETLARYITLIGPLLLALGLLGVYIEIRTPGIGVPGIGGAILLMIYFFGHYVAGLAGNEEIFLVVVGLVLIAIEVFLIPGFGVAGIVGLLCLVAGIGLGLVPATPPSTLPPLPDWDPSYFQEYVARAVYQLAGAVALLIAGIYVLGRVLPKTAAYHGLVLSQALSAGDGYVSSDRHSRYDRYLGKQAIALTTLRPAGTVTLEDDDRIDVVTEGDMVPKGTRVVITEIRGTRVVVRPVADSDA
jgi:membrane-bound serine protease (ClpP class)